MILLVEVQGDIFIAKNTFGNVFSDQAFLKIQKDAFTNNHAVYSYADVDVRDYHHE